ncbi:LTA synthase family protein [Halorussus pelagicus]|uniref:hypothetical protein n=1 Tax=Halorussus pelagicus TaxID=2505977 RepID=UPI000FFBBD26|nr:hypothetical protein [Halorussus pelagicus]
MSWLPSSWTTRTGARTETGRVATRANAVKILLILGSVAVLNAVYLWSYRGALSGFTFARLGVLSTHVRNDLFLMEATASFPFGAYYLRSLQAVLGGSLVDALYLPVIPLVSPLFIYPFVRLFFDNRRVAALATVPMFLLVFADTYHFRAYEMGKLFFLLFVFATALFLNDFEKYRYRFGLLSMLFYLGVKLFAPPMEVWAVTWVGFLVLLALFRRLYRGDLTITRRTVARLVALELTFVVLLFAYNNKFYNQLLVDFPLTGENILYSVFALASVLASDPVTVESQYVAVSEAPRLLQLGNVLTFVVIAIPCALVPLSRLIRSGPSFVFRNARELLAVSLLATYSEDLLLYSLVGSGIQLRYVELVFPAVALYYYADASLGDLVPAASLRKAMPAALAVLLLTSSFAVGYEYANETQRQYVNEDAANALTAWLYDYRTGEEITTDFHTFGTVVAHSGIQFGEPYVTNLQRIEPETYEKLDNAETDDSYRMNYFVVNRRTIDQPVMRGPPTWTNFEPLEGYTDAMNAERSLGKVYASDTFHVYKAGAMGGGDGADGAVNESANESRNGSASAVAERALASARSAALLEKPVTALLRPDTSRSSRRIAPD